MNQINRHNYEAYLLDFSEGNLSEEMQMELELFLIQHPQLGIDLNELSLINVDSEPVSFKGKNQLKKAEIELVSEAQFINYIEELSNEQEKLHIEKSCALNPKLFTELATFKYTIFQPDLSIIYKNKAQLKRKPKVIWFNLKATQFAAAASILLILGLIFLWPNPENIITKSELAKYDSATKSSSNEITHNQSVKIAGKDRNNVINEPAVKKKNSRVANNPISLNNNSLITHTSTSIPIENKNPEITPLDNKTPAIEEKLALSVNEANSSSQNTTIVTTISENDEAAAIENGAKKKRGIWSIAEKTLKNLNTLGVKSVNGEVENGKNSEAYALTLGGISITHKKSGEKL